MFIPMQLEWVKCQGDVWCKLNSVNLNHEHFENMSGVYIIWHGGATAATVYIGQGVIKDRLSQHRSNPIIQSYDPLGLFVTWASVAQSSRDGVEAYLAGRLKPKVGDAYPDVRPIEVNLPW